MRRVGIMALILVFALLFVPACEESSEGVTRTGLELRFSNCVTFAVHVFIDGEYWGRYSSDEEERAFLEIPSGSYELYARSNASLVEQDKYFCWTETVSVSDGSVTTLILDCTGAQCPPSTASDN